MPNISLNGKPLDNAQVRPLAEAYQSELGFKLASTSTENNGLDEIFFKQDGKIHVLYSDALNLSDLAPIAANHTLIRDGKQVEILKIANETNSTMERFKTVAGKSLSSGLDNGVGGAAAGIAVVILKLGGGDNKGISLGIGALAGFVSGFAWGAGSNMVSELKKDLNPQWQTIQDIVQI